MQTSLQRIAEKSALQKEYRFQNLMILLTTGFLHWCWKKLNKKSAPGVDRVTAWQYRENLEGNIAKLVESVKGGWYRAKLILRRFIPNPGGKLRPLGIPATSDKLLQTAVTMILEAIFEPIWLAALVTDHTWVHWMRLKTYPFIFNSVVITILKKPISKASLIT